MKEIFYKVFNKLRGCWFILTHEKWIVGICNKEKTYLAVNVTCSEMADLYVHLGSILETEIETSTAVNLAQQIADHGSN